MPFRPLLTAFLFAGASLALTGCPDSGPAPESSASLATPAQVLESRTPAVATPANPDASRYNASAIKPEEGDYDPKTDLLTAVGRGVPPANAKNPAQARLMAERAARVVAMRNLLRNYRALTGQAMPEGQTEGVLGGVQVLDKRRNADGSVTMTVAIKAGDVRPR